jgi:lipopolysaccharide export system protein LptA
MRKLPVLSAARIWSSATLLAITMLATAPAPAQNLFSQGGNQPVTIRADNGIEWIRDQRKYVARGNATASRDNATIKADLLTAYYREKSTGKGQEIFRVDATGNVRITANEQEAVGDKAVYDIDQAVFVLKGKKLQFRSKQGLLTARDSLEYWEVKRLAVARGDAVVVRDAQRLSADVMTAHIEDQAPANSAKPETAPKKGGDKDPFGGSRIRQIDAFGNVHVSLRKGIVRGDTAVYEPAKGIATICGSVSITSGKNQLKGQCADVNLKTGIYRLKGRATGLVMPTRKKKP